MIRCIMCSICLLGSFFYYLIIIVIHRLNRSKSNLFVSLSIELLAAACGSSLRWSVLRNSSNRAFITRCSSSS